MIASIGGNTWPILAFSGFAESPGSSAAYIWTLGWLAEGMAIEMASKVDAFVIVVKLEKY